jgi:CheY-like chemotaxis protein
VSAGILIIEDDADIRESLQQVLELEGYTVYTAGNGKEGLALLQRIERPSLILLDLMMPIMNGWEFLEAQRADAQVADVPVVIVSAANDVSKISRAAEIVKKPVDLDQLLDLIARYAHDGQGRVTPPAR